MGLETGCNPDIVHQGGWVLAIFAEGLDHVEDVVSEGSDVEVMVEDAEVYLKSHLLGRSQW